MEKKKYIWFALLLLYLPLVSQAQESNYRVKKIASSTGLIKLDTMTIFWPSLELTNAQGQRIPCTIDTANNAITIPPKDTLIAYYRVFSGDFHSAHFHKDTAIVFNPANSLENPYLYSADLEPEDFFGGTAIKKSGSISRGISVGNSQNLSVNSSLNMQLSGNITPNLKILASLSDANIPIQADGNTNKLQEFDQLFIQVYNDNFKLIGGDFWLNSPTGYFMQYKKRAQGITGEYHAYLDEAKTKSWNMYAGAAFSKGKFNRQMIAGTEGNQGPYKLAGADNETFITVLSGTERVYINGKLLERGQEYDYTINYNTAEITFTPRQLITKNARIIVAFQYSDQNYARSLMVGGIGYQTKKLKGWVNVYSEQDAKNQSIQQTLSSPQKLLLSQIGDSLQNAVSPSIDSVGYSDSQVLYKMVDTLGYDSVLVFSVNKDSAFYSAKFAVVGAGKGNYVFDNFNALGRVYKWVAPVGGVPQGDCAPVSVLIAPQKRQMVTAGVDVNLGKKMHLFSEASVSNNDINTFSKIDKGNNVDMGSKTILYSEVGLGRDSVQKWKFNTQTQVEYIGKNFKEVERFRSVEFERDWNILDQKLIGSQLVANTLLNFERKNRGNIGVTGESFVWGNNFSGFKGGAQGQWQQKGFNATFSGSALQTSGAKQSFFTRHKVDVSQNLGPLRVGFQDEFELNKIDAKTQAPSRQLSTNSYQFIDWQFYITQRDSSKNNFKIYYSQRDDKKSDSSSLRNAAHAYNVGGSFDWTTNPKSQLRTLVNYRMLRIQDTSLINVAPENTLLGRVEYNLNVWKGALRSNTYYEVGSGLQLKQEFVYIQVTAGQGIYTWIDYNGDGVKDLNEFEIAAYSDQATYIRVFTPSNTYVKVYSNEFSQSLFLQPERAFSHKKGFLHFLGRFSNQAQFRVARKTNQSKNGAVFNPFEADQNNPNLMSLTSSMRNTFYFNRTNQIFGADYVYSNVQSKTLLASGFDGRQTEFHQLNLRWNIAKKFAIKNTAEMGQKKSTVDYTTGRNYSVSYTSLKPEFSYQPGTAFRAAASVRLEEDRNTPGLGGEKANVTDVGLEIRYNQSQKGSLSSTFNVVNIKYNGNTNSAVGFMMLEALKPGENYTWSLVYQRNIGKNLQLSIRYNGRKSQLSKTINTGGVELRAFF